MGKNTNTVFCKKCQKKIDLTVHSYETFKLLEQKQMGLLPDNKELTSLKNRITDIEDEIKKIETWKKKYTKIFNDMDELQKEDEEYKKNNR